MGATPAWCTLSLSLPESDPDWIDAFLDGFLDLARQRAIALVGGDTTRGPLSIGVTAHGLVSPTQALRRDAARVGDDLWITGTLGDAAGALAQWRAGGAIEPALRARLDRPQPRVEAGIALRDRAHACIDVSDGLLADLGHVLRASHAGARIELATLPASDALRAAFEAERRAELQLNGGDDYELCFSAPVAQRAAIESELKNVVPRVTRIGRIEADPGLHIVAADGRPWQGRARGWDHFGGDPA
jgi:thiamine-monophosphate kinase